MSRFSRETMLAELERAENQWDIVIVGGGATGQGAALDAASRGYRTLLLEQADFGKGTSSRSTKLAHGGVRYLQQGNLKLVVDALKERGLMRRNAPHLVHNLAFVVPNYDWWEAPFYGVGLRVYDMLAGRLGFGRSKVLSRETTLERIPTIETDGLIGGVIYYDGQFDDARLVVNLAQTAVEQGATALNYCRVEGLLKNSDGLVEGVEARDLESGREFALKARVAINATGAYCDALRQQDDAAARPIVAPSQGVHLVLDKSFLPGDSAIMVPHTDDGRVMFAIPWHDCVVVGTTDTPVDETPLEPRPREEEIAFLLEHAARYLTRDPKPEDVLSAFAGLRPLVGGEDSEDTASISRDHTITISRSGLVTIAGGKWTTYRHMAEDTIDQAATLGGLEERPCVTRTLNIHGYRAASEQSGRLAGYGSDAPRVQALCAQRPEWSEPIHPARPWLTGEVVWAVREEMARTVEDFLSRRTRALLLGAAVSVEMAPKVARAMADELGRDEDWIRGQVEQFTALAEGYRVG